jgi:hypothetical protein
MAVPVAGGSHRVDRIHLITGHQQRGHHQAPVDLDPGGASSQLGDQLVLLDEPIHPH